MAVQYVRSYPTLVIIMIIALHPLLFSMQLFPYINPNSSLFIAF
jgi:hypothetical protein